MKYNKSAIADMMDDCKKVQIVTDAIALLEDGFPLDDATKNRLGSIGVDHVEFTERFEIRE